MVRKRTFVQQIAVALFVILALPGCNEGHGHHSPTAPPDVIVGSGNVVRETRPVSGVNAVKLVGVGDVRLEQTGSEGLVVQAEDNILPHLTTEVIGGVLVISQDRNASLQTTRPIVFYVDVISIDAAELVGAGNIECGRFEGSRLELRTIGVGNIDFSNLAIDELEVSVSGVGRALVSGSTQSQRVVIAGVGSYEAKYLDSSFARVELASVGTATVRVSDRLEAIVTGSGCLYYIGDPVIDASSSGNACIRKIN